MTIRHTMFTALALLLSAPAVAQEPAAEVAPPAASTPETDVASASEPAAPTEAAPPAAPASEAAPAAAPEPASPTTPAADAAPAAAPEAAPSVVEQSDDGPVLDLPPEVDAPVAPVAPTAGVYGAQQTIAQFARRGSGVGGYAEMHYVHENIGEDDSVADLDLHRLVLFVANDLGADFRWYSEIEIEHAIVHEGSPGEVSVEQGFLDWFLFDDALALRAGVMLVPMGIINTWHEPPLFNGVERPTVDKVVMPSTWSEGGVGMFGKSGPVRYELYVVGGLNAANFRAKDGIRKGRQKVGHAGANGLAVTGRIEYEPVLGVVGGLAGYHGLAGPNGDLFKAGSDPMAPEELDIDVPVTGVSLDVRGRKLGIEARAVFAAFAIGDTDELNASVDGETGEARNPGVGEQLIGGYAEAGYDVLYTATTEQQLVPFVRFERYDTQVGIGGDSAITEWTMGASYRPMSQVAFKADYKHVAPEADGADSTQTLSLGVGVMY